MIKNKEELDALISGRVQPHIYAFSTNTIPNYLKVGDTYRSVSKRIEEWKIHFPNLQKEFSGVATVASNTFFRDYAVHQYLIDELRRERLTKDDIPSYIHFSNEFFKNTQASDVESAIADIKENFNNNTKKYQYYDYESKRLPVQHKYSSTGKWCVRGLQKKAVDNFVDAFKRGQRNLLMYAVMRFGKTFTSLCCALEINAKIVLVVSGKADVENEWKKTVESADNFNELYVFKNKCDLVYNSNLIKDTLQNGKRVILFLTLQELQGPDLKDRHKELFGSSIDLLIVDETHFGARAEKYGYVIRTIKDTSDKEYTNRNIEFDDFTDITYAEKEIKALDAKITLHLSGTPYRVLMGSEFAKEDIIVSCQYTDIINEKINWDLEHLQKDSINEETNVNEWDNPYYGIPQMIRFAFNPNASSIKKLEELKESGCTIMYPLIKTA